MGKDASREATTCRESLRHINEQVSELRNRAAREKRQLSRRESKEIETLQAVSSVIAEELRSWVAKGAFNPAGANDVQRGIRQEGGRPGNVLRKEDRMVDWVEARGLGLQGFSDSMRSELDDASRFSLGRAIHGAVSGRWDADSELERRALQESVNAQGGFLLPTPLSAKTIDKIRNAMRVGQAGATIVPMEAAQLFMPRLDVDPVPEWHAESGNVNASNETFSRITFSTKTIDCMIRMSLELFEDVPSESAALIENGIVQSIALEIDRAALRGDGTSNAPVGVLHQSGVTLTVLAVNGKSPTWDDVLNGVSTLRIANVEPNAMIHAARTEQSLGLLKDSQGRYLQPPVGVEGVQRLVSNQVPVNLVTGSANNTSEIFIGRWSDLAVGWRVGVGFSVTNAPDDLGSSAGRSTASVRVLRERFADTLEVGLLSWCRLDVQLFHGQSFNVLQGVLP
jgi:HK97 family phage major capsid protein